MICFSLMWAPTFGMKQGPPPRPGNPGNDLRISLKTGTRAITCLRKDTLVYVFNSAGLDYP